MDWSKLNFLRNLGVSWKLSIIPIFAVVALIAVYVITRVNLETYTTKVDQASTAEAIIKHEEAARIAEKNYLRRDDEEEIDKLREETQRIEELAKRTKATLNEAKDRALMDRLLQANDSYTTSFDKVVDSRETFQEVNGDMVAAARTAEEKAGNLANDQAEELGALMANGGDQQTMSTKLDQLEAANRMVVLLKDARSAEKNYIRRDDEAELQEAKEAIQKAQDIAGQTKATLNEAKDRRRMDELVAAGNTYLDRLDQYAQVREESQEQVTAIVEAANKLEEEAETLANAQQAESREVRSSLESTILTVNVAAILITAGFAFVVARLILGPIQSVAAAVQHIQRNKDFSRRAEVDGSDEINQMGASVNELVAHQSQILGELQEQSSQVAAASEELSSTADEITQSAQASSKRVEEVTNSAQEVNNVVQDVAQNISQVSDSVSKTTERTQEGMKTVNEAAERIGNLKGSTDRVNEIMETIENIAKQTDLLALNAAIEAANAGEQGKGFAVVADEVRKLAEQTSEATKQVNQIVSDLRDQSDSSVSAMDQVQDRMNQIMEMVENADQSANQIAASAEELAATMSETTDNMGEISSNVDQVAGSVTQVESSAQQLGELAYSLRSTVADFRLN